MTSPSTSTTRLSPSQPYRNSFSYRRFSTSRVSDTRGSGAGAGNDEAEGDAGDDLSDGDDRTGSASRRMDSARGAGGRLQTLLRVGSDEKSALQRQGIEEEAIEEDSAEDESSLSDIGGPAKKDMGKGKAKVPEREVDGGAERDELDSTPTPTSVPADGAASPAMSVLTEVPDEVKPAPAAAPAAAAAATAPAKRPRKKKAGDEDGAPAKKRKGVSN